MSLDPVERHEEREDDERSQHIARDVRQPVPHSSPLERLAGGTKLDEHLANEDERKQLELLTNRSGDRLCEREDEDEPRHLEHEQKGEDDADRDDMAARHDTSETVRQPSATRELHQRQHGDENDHQCRLGRSPGGGGFPSSLEPVEGDAGGLENPVSSARRHVPFGCQGGSPWHGNAGAKALNGHSPTPQVVGAARSIQSGNSTDRF